MKWIGLKNLIGIGKKKKKIMDLIIDFCKSFDFR